MLNLKLFQASSLYIFQQIVWSRIAILTKYASLLPFTGAVYLSASVRLVGNKHQRLARGSRYTLVTLTLPKYNMA